MGEDPVDRTGELVRRAREPGAEPESFSRLYERVAPSLHVWFGLRVSPALRKRFDTDDGVQETCLRAHRAFERYDPSRGSFRAWLLGIAERVLLEALADLARGRGPHTGPSPPELEEVPAEATTVTRAVARDEVLTEFEGELEGLDEADRKLLVHRGLEERAHVEVAELLGLDEGTVRKRWQRLLERLRGRPGFAKLELWVR